MDNIRRQVLRDLHRTLLRDLETESVLEHMYQSGTLSEDDCDRVKMAGTRKDRCKKFLHMLPRRGDKAYHVFLEALKEEHLSHLAEELKCHEEYPFCYEIRMFNNKQYHIYICLIINNIIIYIL